VGEIKDRCKLKRNNGTDLNARKDKLMQLEITECHRIAKDKNRKHVRLKKRENFPPKCLI